MFSDAWRHLRDSLQPGLANPDDPPALVREKMHAVHPTDYPDDVEVEHLVLGGVPAAFISTPEAAGSERLVMMVHGGAFVSTGIEHYIPYAASLSRIFRARFAVFEYRLAPEHRFPAALDDSLAVYEALLADGLDPGKLAVIGDSCGGGIAMAMLFRLRDEGRPLPAAYAGLTPWFDLEMTGESALSPRGVDPYVDPQWIRNRGRDYAGPERDLRDPLLSPLYGDFSGLPPLFLGVGEIDITRDDSTRLAARAGGDGGAVTLEINPGMIHGFYGLCELAPECFEACERIGRFLDRHWCSTCLKTEGSG